MRTSIARPQVPVCQLCDFMSTQQPAIRNSILRNASRPLSTSRRLQKTASSTPNSAKTKKVQPAQPTASQGRTAPITTSTFNTTGRNQQQEHIAEISQKISSLLSTEQLPSDEEVVTLLEQLKKVADDVVEPPTEREQGGVGASGLLSAGEGSATTRSSIKSTIQPPEVRFAIDKLSELTEELIRHPLVFITPDVLHLYIEVQARLGKPNSFPGVFELYATKPIPKEGTSPIVFEEQTPNNSANAIPAATADLALQAAIDAKDLRAAMGIVEESYSVPAYRRAKFIRKALLPVTGFAVAPVAAYTVASQMALYQSTMDQTVATNVAFAGIASYLAFTGTIGFVALSTSNDQMDRVTWAQGMPLRERWIREDERAAIDKIAGAWGFRETWRRGEEEGQDWESLREWIGRKGMILDRVDLMEGME